MNRTQNTNRTTGGLSTEDIAHPTAGTERAPATGEQAPASAATKVESAPTMPESTDVKSEPATRDSEPAAPESEPAAPESELVTRDSEPAAPEPEPATPRPGAPDTGEAAGDEGAPERLLLPDDERRFREHWQAVQGTFVDAPRDAVHAADALVADVMRTLADTFAQHKHELESQWSQGRQVDTETLRQTLRRYRSFFNRLLTT
ncbi:hypothetical protein ACFC09_11390 [Streptomyces sp. NPDC056161]|uniref:hypothetical protein n=1 Tax=Streptomyces sp. NPDC056161 TaxID=3345732 RepID=UPI0035E3A5C4